MVLKTVAVVGASGALGKPVVDALIKAGFSVTAVTRQSSKAVFHAAVDVQRADPSSPDSLIKALSGQDAVIMTIATSESGNQTRYIEAAVAAGAKRFVPAEWSHNTRPGKLTGPLIDMLSGKTKTADYLIEQAKLHPGFTWTGIATSAFLEWGLDHGVFGINLAARTALIFDSDSEPRTDQTANRYYDVVEHTVTQNELLRLFEEETGAKLTITRTASGAVAKARDEKIAKGDMSAFVEALWVYNFADGAGNAVKQGDVANSELGLVARDLRGIVREYVQLRVA